MLYLDRSNYLSFAIDMPITMKLPIDFTINKAIVEPLCMYPFTGLAQGITNRLIGNV
jgi:hypothetical protein